MFVFKKTIEVLCLTLLAKAQAQGLTDIRETDEVLEAAIEETDFE